jgi:hypothetical protein
MGETERDPIIAQVRATLRGAPEAVPDQRAVARVLAAAWESPRPSWLRRAIDAWRFPVLSGLGAGAIAVGALALGFVTRGAVTPRGQESEPLAAAGTPTGEYPVQLAAFDAEAVRVPTQFVFEYEGAGEISVVGDFNDWQVGEYPMTRLPNGLWTTTVPLVPGRHVYQFAVDGTLLVADPRAPKAGDADYGSEGSVVMVFAR